MPDVLGGCKAYLLRHARAVISYVVDAGLHVFLTDGPLAAVNFHVGSW